MTRRCPACNLPMRMIGQVVAATSNDRLSHGVLAVCSACQARAVRLPPSARMKLYDRAANRALADPDRYLCKTYPTAGAARLARAMLMHPEHGRAMLEGMGWR